VRADDGGAVGRASATERAFVPFTKADLEQSLPARFALQVARHGDRLAVQCGAERLSYVELGRLAHRIARGLAAQRGPDAEPVVLLVRQGAPLVAAILGILEAGKFYVPLDPSAPAAELAQQVAASAARLVIADEACQTVAERFAAADRKVWQLERIGGTAESDGPAIAPDAYAYVFYTSGSTGTPKGVVDSHRNVLHNVMRYTNALRIGADDRLTLLQAPHFSGAVSSLFGALLNGAAVFPFDLKRQSIGEIARTVVEHEITIWHSVPALFELLVETGLRFPSLRLIRLEGDQATRRHLELFQRAFGPGCTLVNGLGATETGITLQFFVGHDTAVEGNALPLGYATEDMATLILGDAGETLGPGEVGEIAIRSRYLALGYWRDPARTAAAFAPLPGTSGERLYRTGDLGWLRPDGCLEYLGRRDFRPRLRGCWVDVDAIEAALLALDDVHSAVVKVCQFPEGSEQLVGYVVPAAGAARGDCRRRASRRASCSSIGCRSTPISRSTAPPCRCPTGCGPTSRRDSRRRAIRSSRSSF
jgi:amino acid adenylation domain-containing protein